MAKVNIAEAVKNSQNEGHFEQKTLKKSNELSSQKKAGRKTKSDDEKSSFQISFYLTQAELKELKDYIETLPISSTPSRVAKECYFRGLKSLNNRN